MSRYTKEQCKFLVEICNKNDQKFKSTIEELRQTWPESELPSRYMLNNLIRGNENDGYELISVKQQKLKKKVEAVREKLAENPHLTTAQLESDLGIPRSTLQRIINSNTEIIKRKEKIPAADCITKKNRPKAEIIFDRNAIVEDVYNAFDKSQYFTTNDLMKITNQRMGNLKMVLNEVCNFHVKEPHKNMWELKSMNDACEENADVSYISIDGETYETLCAVDCVLSEETMGLHM